MKRSFLLVSLLLVGCTSVGVTPVRPGPEKPKDHPLDIYTSEAEVKRPFEVCCLIDSRTGTTVFHGKTAAAAINNAKAAARKQGADALIVISADTEGVTLTSWGRGKVIIKGIRYTN